MIVKKQFKLIMFEDSCLHSSFLSAKGFKSALYSSFLSAKGFKSAMFEDSYLYSSFLSAFVFFIRICLTCSSSVIPVSVKISCRNLPLIGKVRSIK